jgi:DNA-binding XRE family transcriptional regulator
MERESTRCRVCKLVQFVSSTEKCVRCHAPYKPTVEAPVVEIAKPMAVQKSTLYWLPIVLCCLRQSVGLSQSEVAQKVGWARSYISGVERGRFTPFVPQLRLYAEALGTSASHVFRMAEFLADGR